MDEITPSYYAAGEQTLVFEFRGNGFSSLPAGTVVVTSYNNDNPLQFRYADLSASALRVEVIDDNHMRTISPSYNLGAPRYAGAILSGDRDSIFWVNESKPLP